MKNPETLNIGISTQGRVMPEIQNLLKRAGYPDFEWGPKTKTLMIPDTNICLIGVKGAEELAFRVDQYLLDGVIIGSDVAQEVNLIIQDEGRKNERATQDCLLNSVFDTQKCAARLALLMPNDLNIAQTFWEQKALTILSKYSLIANKKTRGMQVLNPNLSIREIESQADTLAGMTSQLAYDIVDSGKTAKEAGLNVMDGEIYDFGGDKKINLPQQIPVSLQMFNNQNSDQENSMIDFVQNLKCDPSYMGYVNFRQGWE